MAYAPLAQALQGAVGEAVKAPAAQSVQFLAPAAVAKLPAEQATHVPAPWGDVVPAAHCVQAVLPVAAATVPASQDVHTVAEAALEYLPTGQLAQAAEAEGAYWPFWHVMQAVAPAGEYEPVTHAEHEAELAAALKVPAGQALQTPPER